MRRGRYSGRHFAWALALSLFVHVVFVAPRLLEPLADMLRQKEDVEVAFLPDITTDATTEEAIPEPDPSNPDKPKPEVEKKKKPEELAKAPEPAKLPEPPKPEPPKPLVKAEPPPPQPPPVIDKRKQMVDQTRFPEEPDNAEAKYLSQTNHRAAEETRTESTNLVRESSGQERASQQNDNQAKEAGEKDQKIAELENRQGTDLPREAPQHGKEGQSQDARPTKPGPLSMRNLVPRTIDRAEVKQREGVERQETAAGDLPMQRQGQEGQRAGAVKKGGNVKLTLDHHAFDNIEGFATAERERREAAKAERSHVRGRFDRYLDKLAALKSSLENFTPEVKIGNQAELGTRASPFAGYITAMHRQIHKIFTFGFLADQEGRFGRGAFEDETLWTQVQISLNGDGTVDKVGVIRASGNVAFDAVAIDSVMSAAPFPTPPQAIRSANGKVYMDWQFHRDDRACGTFGVDPHILTTPAEGVEHDTTETGAGTHRVRGPNTASGANLPSAAAIAGGASNAKPGSSSSEEGGPRRLQREASNVAAATVVPEVNAEVHNTAEGWFAAWARGDVAWLAGWSAVPFLAGGQVVAKTPDALRSVYKQMLAEVSTRKVGAIDILTPGGIRSKTGGLPPGGEESGMLFALGEAGGERMVLLLKKSEQGWRVAGLVR